MKKQPLTADILGEMVLLGTGTSVGVPALGCHCDVCRSDNPRNKRTRCSAILGLPQGNLLIDTAPDLRSQLLREKLGIVHSVLYTHEHADHVAGFDDLRLFQFYLGYPVPVYCNSVVEMRLRQAFDYAFANTEQTHAGAVPSVDIRTISTEPFEVLGTEVVPIPLKHGPRFDVLGFRVGNVAYCTDVKTIPEASWPLLENLDTLIIDALRPREHPTHMNLEEAIDVAQTLHPKMTYFTHCSCDVDYDTTNESLPDRIEVAFDGLRIPLT